ncbi:transcription factor HES-5-like [Oncorhynchus keta]|uniref:transcription factor HES-5-like n=1 Tax=Oncorhynchus keta TaxID=8018 RepID=UPI0015F98DC0|nr:transcription factor HES-5-like [Oncorhynchus keta]
MAPCSTNFSFQHLRFAEKDIKIRKPIVEKMRRDRINGCIEQLKLILEKEFHKQDPNTKLEKADILEMTVSFLRQQLQPDPSQRDYGEGYSQCWRESLQFLSGSPKRDTTSIITSAGPLQGLQQRLSTQVQRSIQQRPVVHSTSPVSSTLRPTTNTNTTLHDTGAKGPVWRPW